MRAFCLIRNLPAPRQAAFKAALRFAGFEVMSALPSSIDATDVLVIGDDATNSSMALRGISPTPARW